MATPSEHGDGRSFVQQAAQQAEAHVFDHERELDWRDPSCDQPIGFDVENGDAIDSIPPVGLVP